LYASLHIPNGTAGANASQAASQVLPAIMGKHPCFGGPYSNYYERFMANLN
jgi:hypothetical protein